MLNFLLCPTPEYGHFGPVCLEYNGNDGQNCSVLCFVLQLCTVSTLKLQRNSWWR